MQNIKTLVSMIAIGGSLIACTPSSPSSTAVGEEPDQEVLSYSKDSLRSIYNEITEYYKKIDHKVIQPAEGYLKNPYLIPAGFYKQMWDWDGFFMGSYFIAEGKPEYMKYWALNLMQGIDKEGYVSGCATTKGPRPIFGKFSMKPFLSQGVYLASEAMHDYSWVKPYYEKLKKALAYRDQTQYDAKYGMYFWENAMQSGADNNPALNYFWQEDHRSFIACDMNTLQVREFLAQSDIAQALGYTADAKLYREKANKLTQAINQTLWCDEDDTYYNVDRETGSFYRRVSYSCFWPLVQGIASEENAKNMIELYLLNPDEMKACYGFRSLSMQDPDYNNRNIIKPFSNWQGPVWGLTSFVYSIGLKKYGYEKEIEWLAGTVSNLFLTDLREFETMHESYNADTGEPLAPAASYVDKEGKFVGFISWNLCMKPLLNGIVNNQWTLLEIK
ncbi:MAG: alpha,alpha-trehalase [Massilibacteroides sp.]|nr:alpha,alpha-trehalase [Massilibacteroides sp.]